MHPYMTNEIGRSPEFAGTVHALVEGLAASPSDKVPPNLWNSLVQLNCFLTVVSHQFREPIFDFDEDFDGPHLSGVDICQRCYPDVTVGIVLHVRIDK